MHFGWLPYTTILGNLCGWSKFREKNEICPFFENEVFFYPLSMSNSSEIIKTKLSRTWNALCSLALSLSRFISFLSHIPLSALLLSRSLICSLWSHFAWSWSRWSCSCGLIVSEKFVAVLEKKKNTWGEEEEKREWKTRNSELEKKRKNKKISRKEE